MKNSITDLQAVDFALLKLLCDCYNQISPEGASKSFQRFLKRPDTEKVYLIKDDDVQVALQNITKRRSDPKYKNVDLPLVMFYRDMAINGDINQHIQVCEATRFIREETVWGKDGAMTITTIPLTLRYSLLFLAWDRASLERLALGWWGYIAPLGRKHSRMEVPYTIDGESFKVGASINAPREILTDNEEIGEMGRLWGSRTAIEVNTQAVYGRKVERQDYIIITGKAELKQ